MRNNKKQKVYEFVFRINPDIKEKENYIRHEDNGWNRIREEYLNLKNIKKKKKRSFSLYFEAVNNVYNQIITEKSKISTDVRLFIHFSSPFIEPEIL